MYNCLTDILKLPQIWRITMYTTFDWLTLGIWIIVIAILVYGIVAIHDIPISIAKKRNHPHADAIEAAAWVSLFFLQVLWPFLWIWAFFYKPEVEAKKVSEIQKLQAKINKLNERLIAIEAVQKTKHINVTTDKKKEV